MSYRSTGWSRPGTLILSTILAGILVAGLVPTPNDVQGGTAKMFLIILLSVIFNATIVYFLNKRQKKKDERRGQSYNSDDNSNT